MAGGDHVPAIGDQVVLAELGERRESLSGVQPSAKEVAQIVAVAAQRRGSEIGAMQAIEKPSHPLGIVGRLDRPSCTQCQPPR